MTGDTEAAGTWLNRSLEMRRSLYEADHPLLADTLLLTGRSHWRDGEREPARVAREKARAIRILRFGEDDPGTLEVDRWLEGLSTR